MYQEYNNKYNSRGGYQYLNRENKVVDDEVITLVKATDLIRKSIMDEKEDEMFYEMLINKAPDETTREIISTIMNDEKRHGEILRFIYSNITGEVIQNDNQDIQIENNTTYMEDLKKSLFGELEAVKKYRRIMGAMPSMKLHTLVMSILTDEIRHANLYNYLISKDMNSENNKQIS